MHSTLCYKHVLGDFLSQIAIAEPSCFMGSQDRNSFVFSRPFADNILAMNELPMGCGPLTSTYSHGGCFFFFFQSKNNPPLKKIKIWGFVSLTKAR